MNVDENVAGSPCGEEAAERAPGSEPDWSSFLRDHQNIRALLGVLEAEIGALLEGEGAPRLDLLVEGLHYLTSYIDAYHHAREDAAFELAAQRDERVEDVIREVARQHVAIVEAGAHLLSSLESATMDAPVPKTRLRSEAKAYLDGLRNHLRYEEVEILPRVGALLDAEDWRAVDARVGRRADPLFGPTVEARYRALFESITALAGCDCTFA